MPKEKKQSSVISDNRRARHEYHVEDDIEAGVALCGTEVKSLRAHQSHLNDAFARVENGEIFVYGWHIAPYEQGNRFNVDPMRKRKLLLHRREIRKLEQAVMKQGMALIPLKIYFKQAKVKVLLGLCRGKRDYDKRQTIKERDHQREMAQALKQRG